VSRVIAPIGSPRRPRIGIATRDWNRSSSSSGTYLTRGSSSAFSRMNADSRCSIAHHASPSPRRSSISPTSEAYGADAARRTSFFPSRSSRYTKQACAALASESRRTTLSSTSASSSDDPTVEMISWRTRSSTRADPALVSMRRF
jgi:hypothetical protein